MKLLLLTAGCILSNLCFSQQLKPEIKELMKQTELNPPNALIYSEKGHELKLNSALYSKPDTSPRLNFSILQNIFNLRHTMLPKELVEIKKGRINPNKPGIYLLPQDNMVCIVPDTKHVEKMPNLWKGKVGVPYLSRIPNPALPKLLSLPYPLPKLNGDTR